MPKRILVVDDESRIRQMLCSYLQKEGYESLEAGDGKAALELARRHRPDLIILDLMLPEMDGYEVCRRLRAEGSIPVIMLTARSDEVDKLLGLELGADDYVTKPFSPRELVARAKAVLRRTQRAEEAGEQIITSGSLVINLDLFSVSLDGREIALTPTEFKILALMARHPGRVFSRLQLMEAALGESYEGYERSIDTHVSNLRRKLESEPARPQYINTVYGLGYRFTPQEN
ncbi:MAG: response regulator transcription factor [Bacillota bacterium]